MCIAQDFKAPEWTAEVEGGTLTIRHEGETRLEMPADVALRMLATLQRNRDRENIAANEREKMRPYYASPSTPEPVR